MENKKKHFTLKGMENVFGSYVVLKTNLCKLFAKNVGILFEIILAGTDHFHFFESHQVCVFLD